MPFMGLEIGVLVAIVAAVLGGILAAGKNRSAIGWALLCFILPFCVIVILALKARPEPGSPARPTQTSRAQVTAKVCPQCGERYQIFMRECAKCKVPLKETSEPAGAKPQAKPAPETTLCPFCKEDIRVGAIKCKHCGSMLEAPAAASPGVG